MPTCKAQPTLARRVLKIEIAAFGIIWSLKWISIRPRR